MDQGIRQAFGKAVQCTLDIECTIYFTTVNRENRAVRTRVSFHSVSAVHSTQYISYLLAITLLKLEIRSTGMQTPERTVPYPVTACNIHTICLGTYIYVVYSPASAYPIQIQTTYDACTNILTTYYKDEG